MIRRENLLIETVLPGMRLAATVADAGGAVLLPAGTELTESLLQSLRRRGVADLQIEIEVDEDPLVVEARRMALEGRLTGLFRKAGKGAETLTLYRAILDFRLEKGA